MIRESKLQSNFYNNLQPLSIEGVNFVENVELRPKRKKAMPPGFWKKMRIEEAPPTHREEIADLQGFTMLHPEARSRWIERKALFHARGLPLISKLQYEKIQKINEEIETLGIPANLDLKFINSDVNYGVFLRSEAQMIQKGEVIGIYSGEYEIIGSQQKCDTSYLFSFNGEKIKLRREDLDKVTYQQDPCLEDEFFLCINAKEQGNFTRYINHSSLSPNIEPAFFRLPNEKPVVVFVAAKSILPGEQLLYNYGGSYWEAHEIIPRDMEPNTFLLDRIGSLRLNSPLRQLSEEIKEYLLPLRHFTVKIPNELLHPIVRRLPLLSLRLKEKLDQLEDVVLQRGIPRNLSLIRKRRIWKVCLEENEPSIIKGSLIGSLAGIVTCGNFSNGILIAETNKAKIHLNQDANGNYFRYIKTNQEDGNLRLELFYNEEEDTLQPLAFAEKRIHPGDVLSLIPFQPIRA